MPSRQAATPPCSTDERLTFGRFQLDTEAGVLWRDGQVVPLGPKVVHTRALRVARHGQVVAREELIRQVWGDTVVEDNNLAHNISVLRKILRENPADLFAIETVPRRGYRFCKQESVEPV